jgi:hypothetical protein
VLVSAAFVYVVAHLALVQTTTWMPKYFVEIGRDDTPPLIFIGSSAFAAPLLLLIAPLIKSWSLNRLVVAAVSGVVSLLAAFALVPWAAATHPLLPATILVSGSLIAELTVVPSAHVFVARIAPAHRLGLSFGILGLSESIGSITGIYLGARLYAQAVARDGLSTYWLRIASAAAVLLIIAYAVKVIGDGLWLGAHFLRRR